MNTKMNRAFSTRRRVLAWSAAGLAGTGLIAGVASAATSGGVAASGSARGLTAADVAFDAQTASPSTPGTATGKAGTRARALRQLEQKLARGAVHGEIVLDTKKGMQTVDFQRGTVAGASSGGFQLTDASGTTQSWALDASTKVRERGQRRAAQGGSTSSSAQLTDGENVVVVGLKTDGTLTARTVVVLPAKPTTHDPSAPAPSASAAELQS